MTTRARPQLAAEGHVLGSWLLPYPPSANNLYVTVRTGRGTRTGTRRVVSREAERWRQAARIIVARVPVVVPASGDLAVMLTLHRGHGQRWGDTDNKAKVCVDLLASVLGFSDSRIARLLVERGAPTREGGVTVVLETME